MIAFKNSNTLAHAVNEAGGNRFVPRPYNFYQPDETIWWLVPSIDWPAYKHGKLFFDSRPGKVPGGDGGVYCGFEVEKGVGAVAARGCVFRPEVILKDDWLWGWFVRNITTKLPALPPEQLITVGLGYEPPSGDSPAKEFQFGRATFRLLSDQKLKPYGEPTLDYAKSPHVVEHFKSHVAAQTTLEGFVTELQGLPDWDWLWVTFYIGVVKTEGSARDLWAQHLKLWTPWLAMSGEAMAAYR